MKSMQLVIDIVQEEMKWLKKECRQDVSTGNVEKTNLHKHQDERSHPVTARSGQSQ
jgi:hypothetical protein